MAHAFEAPMHVTRCAECAGPIDPGGYWWVEGADGKRCSEACAAAALKRGVEARAFFMGEPHPASTKVVRKAAPSN